MTVSSHGFGRFSPADAQRYDRQIVTVTTHADVDKPSIPAGTYGPYRVRYVSGKSYLMLIPVDAPTGSLDPDHIVFLSDVASIAT